MAESAPIAQYSKKKLSKKAAKKKENLEDANGVLMAKKISQPTLLPVTSVAPFDIADSAAIQALSYGNATPDQQQRALKWIILKACDFHGMSFRESDRDTAFAEGKRFVAQQLNVLLTQNNIRKIMND